MPKIRKRYLEAQVKKDLREKMVFIGGPRQVGKTTLSKSILGKNDEGYLNWDIPEHRERILKGEWPPTKLWALDEIHKYKRWRNTLKGIYDNHHPKKQIMVTGSARLDMYRRGGDSLQGRYHYLRLHPLSVAELGISNQKEFVNLLELGGFPEPFFRGGKTSAKRWSAEYRSRLLDEDVSSLERVHDVGLMELMMLRLPALVGSPLSVNALREDLGTSFKTAARWITILERLYAIFRLPPMGGPNIQAVKKEQKHYHMDWSVVEENPQRFENLIACHLLKWIHFIQDTKGEDIELRYFRDINGREVDFVVCKKGKPAMALECKWNDSGISKNLLYLKERFPEMDAWQISAIGKKDFVSNDGIRMAPAIKLLKDLI